MGYKDLSFPENSTFLVTGGAGFIGSNLCEAILEMGYQVRCLDDLSTGKRENFKSFEDHESFDFIEGDIRDLETCVKACSGMDYVSHQAAWGSVPRSIELPLLYEEINIRGTLNMLEAARQCDVKKFVYASSSSVYGDEPTIPKVEGREGKLLSPYALTKKVNEDFARLYTELYGLETVGLRYFNVFGRRQDTDGDYAAVIPKFITALLNDETPIINGDGRQSRDFTYIDNVIEANLKALVASKKAAGQAFNIAYGGQEYLNDIFEKLCELLGKKVTAKYGSDRVGDIKHSSADISKARYVLEYMPDFNFTKGIELGVGWYERNYKKIAKSLISIIIPVYNVEEYLQRCLDSIIAQTYSNVEIILVNDGSKDGSGMICNEYEKKNDRIKVVHKENGGSSSARNAGLDVASGEWVGFVDSDDYIEKDMFEKLLNTAKNYDTPIVACGRSRHQLNGSITKMLLPSATTVIANQTALEYAVSNNSFTRSVCNKLFNRKVIRNIRFDYKVSSGEDATFLIEAIAFSGSDVGYIAEALYHCCVRSGSATTSFTSKRLTAFDSWRKIVKDLEPISERLVRTAKGNIVIDAGSLMLKAIDNRKKTYLPAIKKNARPYLRDLFFAKGISLKVKIFGIGTFIFPEIGYKIWKRKKL